MARLKIRSLPLQRIRRKCWRPPNANIQTALLALDKRFDAVNEFHGQLADQQALFARKTDIEQTLQALEKAATKDENATEKRFDAVNEFRLRWGYANNFGAQD
jgi:hypothetical protein